jgi:hypothetical protein
MQLLVIAATVYMQKALDFSTPAKNRIKMSLENQNFRSKC